ncbi:type II toxin-antitoxin system VapC family toxin [Paenibacillus sp. J2TS4]|uniref:type II toxin-antitoxin system VapC family toxin n=1 Tax=Paenibacillus sp. J2TS4 TaxID=2807194 RepID=UPI001B0FD654|nr:hypothetical protein [Paenibacillus sp. J2TS4]GIP34549.1 hypothetical protein J2TS4_37590 [Paenibacillus sp. J2TS4]
MTVNERWDYQQSVFLDESGWVAYMNPDHPNYIKARSFIMDMEDLDRPFVSTSHIIFELHEWLRDHYGYSHAEYFLDTIDRATEVGKLLLIPGNAQIEKEAKNFLMQCPELRYSLREATTAVVLLTYRIRRIFTFNRSFLKLPTLNQDIRVIPTFY